MSAADLSSFPADHRLELHAALLKEASSLAEEELLFTAGPSKSSRLSHLNHIARTVSQNNVTRASKLLTFSAEAGAHIEIVGDLVHFRDPEAFASLFDSVRLEQGAAEEAAHAKKSRQHAAIATARRSRMFSPFGRMVRLAGVIVEGAQRPAAESESFLGTHWARTFERVHTDFNEQGTLDFLNEHGARLDFSQVAPPDINAYRQYLARVPSSAPGPDGLPYAVWRFAGEEGCKTLHAAGSALASGYAPRESFNDSLTVFPPKNPTAMEISNGAYREAKDTRPLGLNCSDNKVIAGVANHTWKSMLADQLGQAQRGFLPGRYPSLNILELDAWCRKLSFPGASELPLLVLFDFAAAFPSISHRSLFTVLRWLKVPAGLMRLLEAFYTEVRGLGLSGQELFRIFAGVLQGCPLSGSLFTISIDAFMRALQKLAG